MDKLGTCKNTYIPPSFITSINCFIFHTKVRASDLGLRGLCRLTEKMFVETNVYYVYILYPYRSLRMQIVNVLQIVVFTYNVYKFYIYTYVICIYKYNIHSPDLMTYCLKRLNFNKKINIYFPVQFSLWYEPCVFSKR